MLFLIPARAGSKRLPGKNTKMFCGLELWRWSIATAERISKDDDYIFLSTDNYCLYEDNQYGSQRTADLCTDETKMDEVIEYYFKLLQKEHSICLLQPTSPTRRDSVVRQCIEHGGQVRTVTDGKPNGQCYIYRRGHEGWIDIETPYEPDIDTQADFDKAERIMMERFK